MPRKEFTKKTRLQAWERCGGFCENKECGAKLTVGKFQYDHIVADAFGGDNGLDNCSVLCNACHTAKTKTDNWEAKKADRVKARHLGAKQSKGKIQSRGFRKAEGQKNASRPLNKWRGF